MVWSTGSWNVDFLSSAIRRFRRLRELSASELVTLAGAAWALRLAAPLLRSRGLQDAQAALSRWAPGRRTHADRATSVARMTYLVAVASDVGPRRPNCLQRSLVLWWLLRRRGIDSEVRIGVRRSRGKEGLDFHAWVEHDGRVLNDASDIRQHFATFDRAIVPRGASFD